MSFIYNFHCKNTWVFYFVCTISFLLQMHLQMLSTCLFWYRKTSLLSSPDRICELRNPSLSWSRVRRLQCTYCIMLSDQAGFLIWTLKLLYHLQSATLACWQGACWFCFNLFESWTPAMRLSWELEVLHLLQLKSLKKICFPWEIKVQRNMCVMQTVRAFIQKESRGESVSCSTCFKEVGSSAIPV